MSETNEIDEAIKNLAKSAGESGPSQSQDYALAVLRLAEARAWINRPNQSHGGGTSTAS